MSPLFIMMLMSVRAVSNPFGMLTRSPTAAAFAAKQGLMNQGLIVERDGVYDLTPKGHCLVEALCATPMPVQEWRMPT